LEICSISRKIANSYPHLLFKLTTPLLVIVIVVVIVVVLAVVVVVVVTTCDDRDAGSTSDRYELAWSVPMKSVDILDPSLPSLYRAPVVDASKLAAQAKSGINKL